MLLKHMARTGLLLAMFAVIGTALVAFTYTGTKDDIANSQREALLKSLNVLVGNLGYDNQLYNDRIQITDERWLGTTQAMTVYRARKQGQPVAAIIETIAPDGYSGRIKLLVAIEYDGTLAGVRVLTHKETPGLGDAIEAERSDWILGFNGKSLSNPAKKGWAVKKDGGKFDQFTGATITPRAVVQAVHKSLQFFRLQRAELFRSASGDNT